jgi:alkaline phosphatase
LFDGRWQRVDHLFGNCDGYGKVGRCRIDGAHHSCNAQVDIAQQLVNAMQAGTIDLTMGGGGRFCLWTDLKMCGLKGRRQDGINLIEKATGMGAQFASDQVSFDALDLSGTAPVLAIFVNSHMKYEVDRSDEPSLTEMTKAAITHLSTNENGYYLEI